MSQDFEARCRTLLGELGIADAQTPLQIAPLPGGVSSDIALISAGDRRLCVKFALAQLKVAADWQAPVHRSRAEYAWLDAVAQIAPEAVPQLYGWSDTTNGFAMAYLDEPGNYLWKTALLAGEPPRGEAAAIGAVLGRIHAASARPGFDRGPFANHDDFNALRLSPYLRHTAERHPHLSAALEAEADRLYACDLALVHGDVSPKNIILRERGPVLLDAECATLGDPAFDVAFCLNHLLLKAVHLPARRRELLAEAGALWAAYAATVDWEPTAALEARIARLLPMLLLARVDGKSPVEYLDGAAQCAIRQIAPVMILYPPTTLEGLRREFARALAEHTP